MAVVAAEPFHITLEAQHVRLKGRPKLCSDCGVCSSSARPLMARSCVFVHNQSEQIELQLHGRNRRDGDELVLGVHRAIHVARMAQPVAGAQWSGIVSSLGALLLERGIVDGVIATRAVPGTRYAPQPFLARTPAEILESRGNKPCISPNLEMLDEVRAAGLKRIAFIGVGCHVHALRAMQAELGLEKLYVIGIPCTDNTTYPDLMRFLKVVSRSPETVVHHEFMQDFRVWLTHEDGSIEKVNFIDLDVGELGGQTAIFPSACLSCFDYQNTLSDITIGYLGAPLGWQWLLVRTELGEELFELIRPFLTFSELMERGNRRAGMRAYIRMLKNPPKRPPAMVRTMVAGLQRWRGPKGVEFARSVIEMKLLRNLQFVRERFPKLERRIIPAHVYRALAPYADAYEQTFGRPLAPQEEPVQISRR
ncbi:MAG: Coenzyme F420 hydrogenase/dehydrogenase, beta subunit C-terminal domain [Roseiflexaceae bacterium]|nr:Coenzyme F420 hydrogenase/dehydrogenase, beta subunit C-terminal domain [Roseiflexaceae bacterium]